LLAQRLREKLDAFLGKIGGLEAHSVKVVGYADRMGSESSNQILSENRVKTVKTYLVSKGIAEDRVQTSAWGETRPSTYAAECKDAKNAKNIACMQPDRHVSIEISGSRMTK
jgi:OOP family OmpA-OmpF porin